MAGKSGRTVIEKTDRTKGQITQGLISKDSEALTVGPKIDARPGILTRRLAFQSNRDGTFELYMLSQMMRDVN